MPYGCLYILKQWFEVPTNVINLLKRKGYQFLQQNDHKLVFFWRGHPTMIVSSVGPLKASMKIRVFVLHRGVFSERQARALEDSLGALFAHEFFGEPLELHEKEHDVAEVVEWFLEERYGFSFERIGRLMWECELFTASFDPEALKLIVRPKEATRVPWTGGSCERCVYNERGYCVRHKTITRSIKSCPDFTPAK